MRHDLFVWALHSLQGIWGGDNIHEHVIVTRPVQLRMDNIKYKTGIGHGVLYGVRGNCYTIEYGGNYVLLYQVDVRSWSLEMTPGALEYLRLAEASEPHPARMTLSEFFRDPFGKV